MTDATASSGNVFADLGVEQAEVHLAKANIAAEICRLIRERELTQKDAAQLLGIDQPKVSALMRGKLSGFTLDRLLRFLTDLDCDVEITVRPAKRKGQGQIAVAA
ncbi:helix-turn-helix domain-containing protein [Azospirillum sp. sgz302134]